MVGGVRGSNQDVPDLSAGVLHLHKDGLGSL